MCLFFLQILFVYKALGGAYNIENSATKSTKNCWAGVFAYLSKSIELIYSTTNVDSK